MLKNEVLRVFGGNRMYFGQIRLNSKFLRRDFFLCQNLIHVGLILADESGQNLLFKHTFIFLVFKLLNWHKISRC